MTPADQLRAHNAEFEKTIYKLVPNAYLAVGYAASNVGMIVGNDGLIIIDTTESTKAAEDILAEFRKISDLPVKAIVYTHSHRDHISGATVFAEGRDVEIIAHKAFESDLVGTNGKPGPHNALMARTARQFGIGLAQGTERINIGLGPGDRPMEGLGQGHIEPNHAIETDGARLTRCGVSSQFSHRKLGPMCRVIALITRPKAMGRPRIKPVDCRTLLWTTDQAAPSQCSRIKTRRSRRDSSSNPAVVFSTIQRTASLIGPPAA
jgi:alkyl sulfatase BDS1-like metallo-beta-lactamase superfamily hydrolase